MVTFDLSLDLHLPLKCMPLNTYTWKHFKTNLPRSSSWLQQALLKNYARGTTRKTQHGTGCLSPPAWHHTDAWVGVTGAGAKKSWNKAAVVATVAVSGQDRDVGTSSGQAVRPVCKLLLGSKYVLLVIGANEKSAP